MDPILLALLEVLPPDWAHKVEAILALMAAVSVVLIPAKALIARYVPAEWRVWFDAVFIAFDWFAANSKPLAERPTKEQRALAQQTRRNRSSKP